MKQIELYCDHVEFREDALYLFMALTEKFLPSVSRPEAYRVKNITAGDKTFIGYHRGWDTTYETIWFESFDTGLMHSIRQGLADARYKYGIFVINEDEARMERVQ